MSADFSIGQLAREAEVPISTVRFYERSGLLRPDGRTEANYRVYSSSTLERLRFIRTAHANGFTLDDVAVLLRFRDGKVSPCGDVETLILERLADLARRASEIRHLKRVMEASLRDCRSGASTGKCQVMERLTRASTGARRLPGRRPRNT